MSPIATVIGNSGGRGRVNVPTPVSAGALGRGPNAPSWASSVVYNERTFDIPIGLTADSFGYQAFNGFDGYNGITYPQTRVEYPTVSTPIGSRKVLQFNFPGQSTSITTLDQVTPPWTYFGSAYTNASVRVTGSWSGTLAFEQSTDGGGSWSAATLTGFGASVTGTSTTVNGLWYANTGNTTPVLLRVRASSWSSGTAVVSVGMQGGQAPANAVLGRIQNTTQGRFYLRMLYRASVNWAHNGNIGTKLLFFSNQQGNNHYFDCLGDNSSVNAIVPFVQLQNTASVKVASSLQVPFGDWADVEWIIETNTPGVSDGKARIWVAGDLAGSSDAVPYFNGVSTPTFGNSGIFFNPTYGGGTNPPPDNLHLQIAAVYMESAP